MTTVVVNIRYKTCDVYIGRSSKRRMHYGNPFSHLESSLASVKVSSRENSVRAFKAWLDGEETFTDRNGKVIDLTIVDPERRQWILDHIEELRDKVLGCHCKPLSCHGNLLADRANALTEE